MLAVHPPISANVSALSLITFVLCPSTTHNNYPNRQQEVARLQEKLGKRSLEVLTRDKEIQGLTNQVRVVRVVQVCGNSGQELLGVHIAWSLCVLPSGIVAQASSRHSLPV